MTYRLSTTALCASLAGLFAISGAASNAFAAETKGADVIETVIVTAQKREENVQKVPLAVQVVGAAQLAAAGVEDFADLTRVSPDLMIRADVQPVNATVSIRGVGTNAFGIGVEPSVAIQVDNVPLAFQARAFSDLNDISRIEVLSGPQSTLYGKSASAGLINIYTLDPSRSFTARAGFERTSDKETGGNFAVSGPVTDNLRYRVTANYDAYAGNITNLYNGHKVNGSDTFSTRGKLVWSPTSTTDVAASLDYIKGSTTVGRPFVALGAAATLQPGVFKGIGSTPPASLVSPNAATFAPGVTAGPTNLNVWNDYETTTAFIGSGQALTITQQTPLGSLMSITSHAHYVMNDTLDSDESALPAYANVQVGDFINNQTTEEVRLASPSAQAFRYTLGLFYADVDYIRHFMRGPMFSLAHWDATEGSKQSAAFGQFEYDVVPKLTLIAGLRAGTERINYTFIDYRAGPAQFSGSNSDDYTTYRVGARYQLADDIMLFATHSTGHKGPTYDLTTGFNQNRANGGPVHPEESKNYEVGAKAQFFERHLTINPTLFSTDYTNFQAQGIQVLADGTTNFRLANVGSLRSRGAEVEMGYRFSHDFGVNFSAAYLDAAIKSFPEAQCYPGQTAALGCIAAGGGVPAHQNLAGHGMPQAPKWKFTASFDYARPLSSGLEMVARGSYTYQSRINFTLAGDPQTVQSGYGVANISGGLRSADRKWELTVFVNNLFDQHYLAGETNSQSGYGGQVALQGLIPRDFKAYGGVKLNIKY